ncbi:hypothetical protein Syun_012910 [Stephania yunnanensis]|uniref:Bifunctional inhibitor/plant lipid transfer protein/seed storage helical domain-containing protein n=1 Tax=Stephania yunnanensis TaxID=152371 RepID=A0AAP0K1C8_9MAGN
MGAVKKCGVAMLVVVVVVCGVALQAQVGESQQNNCSTELNSLTTCAPFVVPGQPMTTPSSDCCTALQTVDHDCLCNTLRIAARIPTACSLPPLNCA